MCFLRERRIKRYEIFERDQLHGDVVGTATLVSLVHLFCINNFIISSYFFITWFPYKQLSVYLCTRGQNMCMCVCEVCLRA